MSLRKLALFAALAAALSLSAGQVMARPGGGGSFGSRGAKTFSAPPATRTAPNAAPIERSITQPRPAGPGISPSLSRPSSGFGRGLLGGLLGAGLIGMLFGHGLFGGLGGLTSILGLLLQVGLVVLLVRFAIGFFRSRQPQAAGYGAAPAGMQNAARGAPQGSFGGAAQQSSFGGMFGGGAAAAPAPLPIVKSDFEAFERRLAEVEAAYSAEDIGTLRRICTPEVASELEQEIADNAAKGLTNRISGVKLLQGDLSESWREADGEYATVAMRFSIVDVMVERATGRPAAGSSAIPGEVTELWTFRRQPGADSSAWALSAMQQAA